jgi:murein DD-endopeptidase MepM/ murein hydrolase activator NlpD
VQLVDGKTFRGDRSRLENFYIFGKPLLAVADGYVTTAVDSLTDEPVGGTTWDEMAGNHVILDIGGGHHVLYGHLKQASLRVQVGDDLRRGQVLGQVGDSGNSDAPHLHLQVQNTPVFDVEDRGLRTYPMVFDGATVPDPRRGDPVGLLTAG